MSFRIHYVEVAGCTIQRCPRQWRNLLDSDDSNRRFCAVCWKDVHLASSPEEVKEFAERGWCVAFDPGVNEVMGYGRLPQNPPEHTEPALLQAITKLRAGQATQEDLRFIALRFLIHGERNEALYYLRLFLEAGGIADIELVTHANKFGIDATDPAPDRK